MKRLPLAAVGPVLVAGIIAAGIIANPPERKGSAASAVYLGEERSSSGAAVLSTDRQVSYPSDDVYAYESGIMNCTDNRHLVLDGQMFAGHDPWGWCHSKVGLRFRDIPLAQGYVVESAYLEVYTRRSQLGDSPKLRIRAQYGDADAFSTRADYDGRRKTAGLPWTPDVGDWSSWEWRRTPDIGDVIQEVVDEGSFGYGDDVALFIEDDASTPRHEIEVGPNARLHIEWTPPDDTATPTSTPTHSPTATPTPTATITPTPTATPTPCVAPDADGDGVCDGLDGCPFGPDPGQQNADSQIGNGTGIAGHDITIPNSAGDLEGDACETDGDADNDGIPDGSDSDPGGDITYDDNNDGDPCAPLGTDLTDDGPSWDSDCNGVRDGWVGPCGSTGDSDGDGLLDAWETCKWGTYASDPDGPGGIDPQDSDGDGIGDCTEAVDTNGNGIILGDFGSDALNSARATLLPAGVGPGQFGKDGDFDLNGNNVIAGDFGTDTLTTARMTLGILPCN
jgi:hypothetical protein